MLSTGLDSLCSEQETSKPLAPMPHHDNIRGAAYYTLEETPGWVHATLEKMQTMKLYAMAEAFEAQRRSSEYTELSFEERLGLLIDTEWTARENRKLARRLRAAKMRHAASIENIDFKPPRGLNRQEILALGSCAWIQGIITCSSSDRPASGNLISGCAFVSAPAGKAIRLTMPAPPACSMSLPSDAAMAPIHGCSTVSPASSSPQLAPRATERHERRDLMEVIEDRSECASMIATQLPIQDWHAVIGDPNQADAICDRLLHNAHRIELKGASMRKTRSAPKPTEDGQNA